MQSLKSNVTVLLPGLETKIIRNLRVMITLILDIEQPQGMTRTNYKARLT